MQRPRTITRRNLYDLVWSKPMTALAEEFGISDRGLAKTCSRHRIPVPPRGYWAKVAAGERPKVPPFLELRDRSLDSITIRGATASLPESVAELARKRKVERESSPTPIRPAADEPLAAIETPHAAVVKTTKLLLAKKPDKEGVIRAAGPGYCGVIVSAPSIERSIYILDALARGLEAIGLTLTPEGDKMSVKRGLESVSFTLLERTKRVKYVPTPEEVAREERRKEKQARAWRRNDWDSISYGSRPPWPEYETEWTGELVFSIDGWADGLRKTWGDGKTQRVERMVPDIVAGIELILEATRVRREASEERERQWKELQRRRELARARVDREERRLSHLQRIVELRREAREIRDWLADLSEVTQPSVDSDLGRMLLWVQERLAEIDRQTGSNAAQAVAGEANLFPEVDELHDPHGDPPPGYGWGY